MITFLILLIAALFVGGITIALIWVLAKIWSILYIGELASFLIGLFLIVNIYLAIWPPNSFFYDEFELNSGLSIRHNSTVLKKHASYPDFHGDYQSWAVFKYESIDLDSLSGGFVERSKCSLNQTDPYIESKHVRCWEIRRKSDQRFYFAIDEKQKIIYFYYYQT